MLSVLTPFVDLSSKVAAGGDFEEQTPDSVTQAPVTPHGPRVLNRKVVMPGRKLIDAWLISNLALPLE
jgi:hypothetical protein